MMRAKMKVVSVTKMSDTQEDLKFSAVCKNGGYPNDGADENNTFALFTPSAELSIIINNPNLIGKFEVGKEFYVDFTEAN